MLRFDELFRRFYHPCMPVPNRDVAAVQRCYPQIYLACHGESRTSHAGSRVEGSMRVLLWLGLALVGLTGVVALVGWLLPVGHTATRSATIARPTADVYASIADVAAYPQWWSDISRVEMLPAEPGAMRFREHTSSGPVVMEVVEAAPPHRFVTRIADPGQPFGGTWTFELAPEPAGTRLPITERGEVYNPIFRFMSRFVFGQTGTMERFLRALSARLGA
jgi:hypothetical protein